jgi:hypothetical protein
MQQERSIDEQTEQLTLAQQIGRAMTVVFVLLIIVAVFTI